MKKLSTFILIIFCFVSMTCCRHESDTQERSNKSIINTSQTQETKISSTKKGESVFSNNVLRQEMHNCYNALSGLFKENRNTFIEVSDVISKVPSERLDIYYNAKSKTITDIYDFENHYSFQTFFSESDQRSVMNCFEKMASVAPQSCDILISKCVPFGEDRTVEFAFKLPELSVDFGIMFDCLESSQEIYGNSIEIEDNWYIFELWGV